MKGLLLKDFYMMKKYCRAYFLITVVFIAVSFFAEENLFVIFYPCLLCGMIPVNLLAYDERSHWMQFSGTLPYTKAQIVSGKYLIGLLTQVVVLMVTGFAQGIRMAIAGSFVLQDLTVLLLLMFCVASTSAITLPFVFKLGVEKGRIAYYLMIGMVCGGSVLASSVLRGHMQSDLRLNLPLALVALVCIGLYALSWYLSIVFYRKREN